MTPENEPGTITPKMYAARMIQAGRDPQGFLDAQDQARREAREAEEAEALRAEAEELLAEPERPEDLPKQYENADAFAVEDPDAFLEWSTDRNLVLTWSHGVTERVTPEGKDTHIRDRESVGWILSSVQRVGDIRQNIEDFRGGR